MYFRGTVCVINLSVSILAKCTERTHECCFKQELQVNTEMPMSHLMDVARH